MHAWADVAYGFFVGNGGDTVPVAFGLVLIILLWVLSLYVLSGC